MNRIFTLLVALCLFGNAWLNAQPQRVIFAIRGFSNQALTYINLTSGVVIDSLAPLGPVANELHVFNNRLYVINSGQFPNGANASIQHGRLANFVVGAAPIKTQSIATGLNPYSIARFSVPTNETFGVVSNLLDSSISLYRLNAPSFNPNQDTIQFVRKISIGRRGPEGVAIVPETNGARVYIANAYNPSTFDYDSVVTVWRFYNNGANDSLVTRIQVRLNPQSVAVDGNGRLHAVCTGNYGFGSPAVFGRISVINPATNAVVATINVGASPSQVVFNSQNIGILSGGFVSDRLIRYNANTFDTIPTPPIAGGSLALLGDTLIIGRTGRITLYNAITLDSITQFNLKPGEPYAGIVAFTVDASVLPVELVEFVGRKTSDGVWLSWKTASERNNAGFEIQRKSQGGEWNALGFVRGKGTTTEAQSYSFLDRTASGIVQYRLKQIDFDGQFEYSNVIEVDAGLPKTFALEQNYPNPFNPTTIIAYQLPIASDVRLELFDMLGKKVATLANGRQEAGAYNIRLDASRYGLASGMYFYRLQAGNFVSTKKMMLVK
ncbi:MAG: T9SS type A sorting domain-containing protein [Chloroherpetonaceae bacterium]|nr:T9SS type A sorting domain-containing protein [Chloroherpetonaceae bacterium]MDW8438475.1 T9SS type A sorting domain-containing protein [Chloroherpetonaceae bacterium]